MGLQIKGIDGLAAKYMLWVDKNLKIFKMLLNLPDKKRENKTKSRRYMTFFLITEGAERIQMKKYMIRL